MKPHLAVVENESAPLSPARAKLQGLLQQQTEAKQRVEKLQSSASRLDEMSAVRDRAAAALAEFDDNARTAMLVWSRGGGGSAPVVDAGARETLLSALTRAQADASAASAAKADLDREILAENQALKAIAVPIAHAVAEILAEAALGPALDELREAVSAAVVKQVRLQQAVQAVYAIAHGAGTLDEMKPTFDIAEKLADSLRKAAAPPPPDGTPAFAAWMKFATALKNDPAAQLKD